MDLKDYLETEGIENKDFAVMVGVTRNTVTNWIHWHSMPHPKTIKRIEQVTNGKVTFKDLMYYWEAKNKYG